MRKHAIGLAGAVLSSAAMAQSSVTLYGLVDAGITYVSNANGHGQVAQTGGNMAGDRWGLRSIEDLGGGMTAVATLEGGFTTGNGALGQNGTLFGRQVFVGLGRDNVGTLTLGRQYSAVGDLVGPYTAVANWAASGAGYGATAGDVDNLNATARVNNSVKFTSASIKGLTYEGLYSFGNQAGAFHTNQIWSLAADYRSGPFGISVGYQDTNRPNYSLYGNKANDSATAVNINSVIYRGYASAEDAKYFATGLSYALGNATLRFVYSNVRYTNIGTISVTGLPGTAAHNVGTAAFNNYMIDAEYMLTPFWQVATSYTYTRNGGTNGRGGATYNQVNAGTHYWLSKRTDIYALYVFQSASGIDSTGARAVAAINGATASSSGHQSLVLAGIRQKF
jgi:predicted porin